MMMFPESVDRQKRSRLSDNTILVGAWSGGLLGVGLGQSRQKLFYLARFTHGFIFLS